ncbi:hypothetical protein [Rhizobium sp. Rhizsp82]|uniref:hypothetical protein n=1 Tax=Rhizobium sp. Rhizsp82 TaxID=3243057 RepID=UPI0039B3E820
MGDFERTFGAGADAANIIDGYTKPRSNSTPEAQRPPFVRPDGMSDIEHDLFLELRAAADEMAENYGVLVGMTNWQILGIVAAMPKTVEELKAFPGVDRVGCGPLFWNYLEATRAKIAAIPQRRLSDGEIIANYAAELREKYNR